MLCITNLSAKYNNVIPISVKSYPYVWKNNNKKFPQQRFTGYVNTYEGFFNKYYNNKPIQDRY